MTERLLALLTLVFAWACRLYPEPFRRLFAEDMVTTFSEECRRVRRCHGLNRMFLHALEAVLRTPIAALAARLEAPFSAPSLHLVHHTEETPMGTTLQDLRYAWRMMARRPALTALAIATLGIGIGVNSSIFSVVNAFLLNDIAAKNPEELVTVYMSKADGSTRHNRMSYPDYVDLRDQNEVFDDVAAVATELLTFDDGQRPRLLFGEAVSGNFFRTLGLEMSAGRDFLPEEDESPGTHPVIILGHGFWQRQFAGDPALIGSTVKMNGHTLTVVGVAPEAYQSVVPGLPGDFWVPMSMVDVLAQRHRLDDRSSGFVLVKARLAPGIGKVRAQAQLATLGARLAQEYPESNEGRELTLVRESDVLIHPEVDGALYGAAGMVMIMVALVLLIACSNIANLLLARISDRREEIAVRLALGCDRGRLVRQLLTESFLLAFAGGLAGLLFAAWTTRLLVGLNPPIPFPITIEIGLDSRVFAFTLGLALLTGLVCGLAPALRSTRGDLVPDLKDPLGELGSGYRKLGLRNLLVVTQVTTSAILLIGAGLFLRSLSRAGSIDLGFGLRQGAVAMTELKFRGYSPEEGRLFYRELLERAHSLPGVRSAALSNNLPLGFTSYGRRAFVEGQTPPDDQGHKIETSAVSPGYFETLDVPLVRGRGFTAGDTSASASVVIVNETAARRFWPGEDPLGQRFAYSQEGPYFEVVGVAEDGKYRTLGEASRAFAYRPFEQDYQTLMSLVVASSVDGSEMAALIRHEIETLDPGLAIVGLRTMTEHVATPLFLPRMGAALLGVLGGLGCVLASMGLYGVVAYTVGRRTREVGIRMAMGAERRDVLRLVVGEGMVLVGLGVALGTALALATSRLLASLLYGISTSDPVTFVAVPVVLLGVALVANLVPALKAVQIEPTTALRYE